MALLRYYAPLGRAPHTFSKVVRDSTLSAIVQIESNGDWDIKARTSSATGLGQFLKATWIQVVGRHKPILMQDFTRDQVLAMRTDPFLSLEMLARFTEDNLDVIGHDSDDGDIYLAHFAGAGTARKLRRADQQADCSTVFSSAAIHANRSILRDKTIGEVRLWASHKMAKARRANDWVKFYADLLRKEIARQSGTDLEREDVKAIEDVPLPSPRPVDRVQPDEDQPVGDPIVWLAQKQLKQLGYYEVGLPDGEFGGRTVGAIASFRQDRGLPPREPVIDQELTEALEQAIKDGWTRPVSDARKNIDEKDLTPKVEAAKQSWLSRQLAKIGITLGGGSIAASELGDYFDTAREYIRPAKQLISTMPWQLWVGLFVAILVFIWWSQRRASQDMQNMAQKGRLFT